jgi:hypothetical protein
MISSLSQFRRMSAFFCWAGCFLATALFCAASAVRAQESHVPLTPAPGRTVHRTGTSPDPSAPPPIPPEEIIKRFAEKEDEFLATRPQYGYRKTIRVEEFGPDGKQSGQLVLVLDVFRAPSGQVVSKVVERPPSTLRYVSLETEDVKDLDKIPAFPMTTSQLVKYDLKYMGTEQVDEIDCYIFKVTPKGLDRAHAYFDGIVWADTQDMEIVRTYGKWVNELGEVHPATAMPFTMFETYRENVAGKYWFPNYERSEAVMHLKDSDVPMRLVIKWTDFKPLIAMPPANATTPTGVAPAQPAPPPPPPASADPVKP